MGILGRLRRFTVRLVALVCLVAIGGGVLGGLVATAGWLLWSTPARSYTMQVTPLELSQLARRSQVVSSDGTVLAVLGSEDRSLVSYEQVPAMLRRAIVAVEDRRFWTHDGVDPHAIVRALHINLGAGTELQGGSTITQQLIKNRVVGNQHSWQRKVREAVLARRLERSYTKQEILTEYLNTVYFGQGAYGVAAAAERFYQRPLRELDIAQVALLAGVISAPEAANPFTAPDAARAQRARALEAMVRDEIITEAQARMAGASPLPTKLPAELAPRTEWAQEIWDRLLTEPQYRFLGATTAERRARILAGGLTITASVDPRLQRLAETAVRAQDGNKPGFTASMVAIEPGTGLVRAMVGSPDWGRSKYNLATHAPGRQVGSTWKSITLTAALMRGYSPRDTVDGSGPCSFDGASIANAGSGYPGMTIRAATTNSVNCAYVRLSRSVGLANVIDTAYALGITQRSLAPVSTLTMGTIEATPLEMATVAATLANDGVRHDPQLVAKVTGPDGQVLFDATKLTGQAVVEPAVTRCVAATLRTVVDEGTGTAARLDRPVAGKTGTTDREGDATFLGFTPQLAAFVWYGNPTVVEPGAGFGGEVPARTFKAFMGPALDGTPVTPEWPGDGGEVCQRSGGKVLESGRRAGR